MSPHSHCSQPAGYGHCIDRCSDYYRDREEGISVNPEEQEGFSGRGGRSWKGCDRLAVLRQGRHRIDSTDGRGDSVTQGRGEEQHRVRTEQVRR